MHSHPYSSQSFPPLGTGVTVIVRCTHIVDTLGRPAETSDWVTVGVDYPVIESRSGRDGRSWVRIITNGGESGLFPPSMFTTVDDSIPVNWVSIVRETGVTLTPESWGVPGFWEDFYDGDLAARNVYFDELAVILESHPDWWLRAQIAPGHILSLELVEIAMDYGQFTISGGGESDLVALVDAALAAPPSSDDGHTVLVLSPHQNNFAMPIEVEVCSGRPLDDRDDWEQVSEHALAVGAAGIVIASPTLDEHRCDLAAGDYLVEISGRGFLVIGWPGTTNPNDAWRIRLWPRWGQRPRPAKIWPGIN